MDDNLNPTHPSTPSRMRKRIGDTKVELNSKGQSQPCHPMPTSSTNGKKGNQADGDAELAR